LVTMRSEIFMPSDVSPEMKPAKRGPYYEMRTYTHKAGDLPKLKSGTQVSVAGLVLIRQRPGTAKGVVFITLEDETGPANAVVWKDVFTANRRLAMSASFMVVLGRIQRDWDAKNGKEGEVIHVVAERFTDLTPQLARMRQAGQEPRPCEAVRSRPSHPAWPLGVAAFGGGACAPLLMTYPLQIEGIGIAKAGAAIGLLTLIGQLGGFLLPVLASTLVGDDGHFDRALAALAAVHLAMVVPALLIARRAAPAPIAMGAAS